jgi:hypothetical protein
MRAMIEPSSSPDRKVRENFFSMMVSLWNG